MRKIILTAVGSALIAASVANVASAAERRHARNTAQEQTFGNGTDTRNSFAEFGVTRVPVYGYDNLPRGNASAAPAGH